MSDLELWFGDCLVEMYKIPDHSVDLILADLPYGTTHCKWDSPIDLDKLWKQYKRVRKDNAAILLFAQLPFDKVLGMSNIQELRYEWIWEKTTATGHFNSKKMPMKAHENVLVFYKHLPVYHPQKTNGHSPVHSFVKYVSTQNKTEIYGTANVEVSGGGNTDRFPRSIQLFSSDKQLLNLHPTQKPLALLEYLIKTYSDEGMVVLDNTMGSGSTGVAARNLNRKFIGIENDKKYYTLAVQRLGS